MEENKRLKTVLIQQALYLFRRYPVSVVSVPELAFMLDVPEQEAIKCIPGQEELLCEVLSHLTADFKERVARHHARAHDAIHELLLYGQNLRDVMQVKDLFNEANLFQFARPKALVAGFKNAFILGIVRQNINDGVLQGFYKPSVHADNMCAVCLRLINMFGFCKEEVTHLLFKGLHIFLRSILTDKGREVYKTYMISGLCI